MNKNFPKVVSSKGESPLTTSKSTIKIEMKNNNLNQNVNIEAIVKNGETRNHLNNLAKTMLDDMKDFANQSVELFNSINTNVTQECHIFLKNASDHKKKIDTLSTEPNDRSRKMEILKSLKERFMQIGFGNFGGINNMNNNQNN